MIILAMLLGGLSLAPRAAAVAIGDRHPDRPAEGDLPTTHTTTPAIPVVPAPTVPETADPKDASPPDLQPVEPQHAPPLSPQPPQSKHSGLEAEPISPNTVKRFAHLRDFQGHVLLGGPFLHVVLAGVPPTGPLITPATPAPWSPAILAVFEKSGDTWIKRRALGTMDLRNAASPKLHAVAVDAGIEADPPAAYATFVFAVDGQTTGKELLSYRFDPEPGRLAVIFDDFVEGDPAKLKTKWQARLGDGAEIALGPESDLGGLSGHEYALLASGKEVAGLLAYRPFAASHVAAGTELVPAAGKDRPQLVEGFELYLTRLGAARLVRRADDVSECLFGAFRPKTFPKPESRMTWLLSCETDAPRTYVTLSLPEGDAGASAVAAPVFIFAGDDLVQRTALVAGDSLRVDVPGATPLQFADTAAGRLIPNAKTVTLARGEHQDVALPSRASGLVRIDMGTDDAPALLTVWRRDADAEEAGVARIEGAGPPVEAVGVNTWLVKEWPVLLDVLPGGYDVALARGGAGIFCRRTVNVQGVDPITVNCSPPRHVAQDRIFADLGLARDVVEPQVYGKVLGVDLLPMTVESGAPPKRKANETAQVAVLTAVDESSGVTLRLIPASAALAERWAKLKPSRSQDVLPAFAKLAREEGGIGLLELGCPGPGLSLFEYELMATRLKPDAVRLFGCRSGTDERALLELWTRLSAARETPLVLTSVSRLAGAAGADFPRLSMPPVKGRDPANIFLAAARAGLLTATDGARVELKKVQANTASVKGAKAPNAEATVVVAPAGTPVTGIVSLYTDKGLLKSEKLAPVDKATDMTLSFVWPQDATLLRAEVTSETGKVLATTALRPFADLTRAEKDTP